MAKKKESKIDKQDDETNLNLSYEYIEKSIQEIQNIINNTNTQLGLLIGFNFTFIRFFLHELPARICLNSHLYCNSCLLLKIFAYGFAVSSIILSFSGLYQSSELQIIKPQSLLKNYDQVTTSELKLAIIDRWQNQLVNFEELAKQKKQLFNRSIILLLVSGLTAILDKILTVILTFSN